MFLQHLQNVIVSSLGSNMQRRHEAVTHKRTSERFRISNWEDFVMLRVKTFKCEVLKQIVDLLFVLLVNVGTFT